jgi:hypothetical protein
MELGDEVNELALFGGFGAWRDGDIHFIDALGFAEIAEGLCGMRSGKDCGTLPNPETMDQVGRCLPEGGERGCGE